ncbi:site-specific integrase [Thomasclavelia sp.]|uniref:tyrosine-type recombinase/integrase n=1 Tax=Thomasclavelia sp. TaxID=3025757 RepID=UPI0025F6E083|nr:site-specific integrase [Thomasclavelia sp.]
MAEKKKNYEIKIILGYDSNGKAIYTSVFTDSYPKVEILRCSSDKLVEETQFKEAIEGWLSHIKNSVKPQSYNKYQSTARLYILPKLGNCDIRLLTAIDVNQFLEQMALSGRQDGKGLSKSSLKTVLFVIKETFQYAYNFGLRSEVLTNIVFPKKKEVEDKLHVLEKKDYQKMIDYIQDDPTPLNIGIAISLCCGLRIGELCALKKEDIDIDGRMIKVQHTLQRIKVSGAKTKTKIVISSPKSKTSIRVVPLPEVLVPLLTRALYFDNDFILSKNEKWIEPRRLSRYFKKLLQKLEIKDTNFHTLRHTFASLCIASGMDDRTLSEILGHSSVNITLDRYVHPNLKIKHEMMNKVNFI